MKNASTTKIVVLSIIATILLLLGSAALWLNNTIFDRDEFRSKVTVVIQSESVRDAIADEVLNQLLVDYPVVRQIANSTIESAISGVLGSSNLQPAIGKIADEIQLTITSSQPREIAINISGTVDFIRNVTATIDSENAAKAATADFPDKIVLVEAGEIPSIYNLGVALIWIGSISGLIAIGIIIFMIWAPDEQTRLKVLKILGASLSVGAIVSLLFISNFTPIVLASTGSTNVQTILINIYEAFTDQLKDQSRTILVVGILFVIAGFLLPFLKEKMTEFIESKKSN